MAETDLDVRVRRTRERLRAAVVRLAAEQPVEEIAVADLVRVARINRTTFYKHAATPADVLADVLYAELDAIRADGLAPDQQSWETSSGRLADHLEHYDAVYTAGLVGRRSAVLHHLLVDHFTASARGLLERDPALLPGGHGTPQWRATAYSGFIAHGMAGIVEAWLAEPAPRDRRLLISASASVMATWFASR